MTADLPIANPTAHPACPSPVGRLVAMSVTTDPTHSCKRCGAPDDDRSAPRGYCSTACFYRQQGEGLITQINQDARFCSTCYDALRDIEPLGELTAKGPAYEPRVTCDDCGHTFRPASTFDREHDLHPDPVADCPECEAAVEYVRPFQRGPKNVADGLQHGRGPLTHGIDARDGPHGYHEFQRESCACGAVDPNATTAELQRADPEGVRERLFLAVRWLGWTDADLPTADRERYDDALAERPYDAALAVGRAVYGGENT